MNSLWKQTVRLPQFPTLETDAETDVLIIGGGMAGLLCAYRLKQAGVRCLLAEAQRICGGVTGCTTAKITAQHGFCYAPLLKQLGRERAEMYLQANLQAVEEYRCLCREIDCDFEEQSAFAYSTSGREVLEEELEALRRLGYPARLAEKLPLPLDTDGAVEFSDQAQFHPLKFAAAIAGDLPILENTMVLQWDGKQALCSGGRTIRAKRAIIATHFPFWNRRGCYFLKLYQERHYVLALEGADPVDGMYVDGSGQGFSFRMAGTRLLLGGGSHRTGKKGGGWRELEDFAVQNYPGSREYGRWAAQDCMSLDGAPYIGPYGSRTPETLVAAGFNAWGMTSSMVAARLLTCEILGRPWEFAPAFAPSRSIFKKQLLINGLEAAGNLLRPTSPRCTHLGCALHWNKTEHSWDCACHGSRFDREGTVLENPAMRNLKKR